MIEGELAEVLGRIADGIERAAAALEKGLEVVETGGTDGVPMVVDVPNYVRSIAFPELCSATCPAVPSVGCAEERGHKGVHRSRVPNWSWANTEVGGEQANDARGE